MIFSSVALARKFTNRFYISSNGFYFFQNLNQNFVGNKKIHKKPELCEKVFQTLNDAIALVPTERRQSNADNVDNDL